MAVSPTVIGSITLTLLIVILFPKVRVLPATRLKYPLFSITRDISPVEKSQPGIAMSSHLIHSVPKKLAIPAEPESISVKVAFPVVINFTVEVLLTVILVALKDGLNEPSLI